MPSPLGSGLQLPNFIQRAVDFAEGVKEKYGDQIDAGLELRELPNSIRDAFESAQNLKEHGFSAAWREARNEIISDAQDPTGKLNLGGKLKLGSGVMHSLTGLWRLGDNIKDIGGAVDALRTASEHGWEGAADAMAEGTDAARDILESGQTALNTAVSGQKIVKSYKAASAAFAEAVPGATPAVRRAAAAAATKAAFKGTTEAVAERFVKKAVVATAAKQAATATVSAGVRTLARETLKEGGELAAKAGMRAAAKAGATTLAKAAGRFAPGVNIAIAALDTANFAATMADPKASTGAKITSGITAAGSILAATNIPVVSQIGAGISLVSSFVGSWFK